MTRRGANTGLREALAPYRRNGEPLHEAVLRLFYVGQDDEQPLPADVREAIRTAADWASAELRRNDRQWNPVAPRRPRQPRRPPRRQKRAIPETLWIPYKDA